jgi:hypothetical protein
MCSAGELGHELGASCVNISNAWYMSSQSLAVLFSSEYSSLQIMMLCHWLIVSPHFEWTYYLCLEMLRGQSRMKRWTPETMKMTTLIPSTCLYRVTQGYSIICQKMLNPHKDHFGSHTSHVIIVVFNPQGGYSVPCVRGNASVARVWGRSGQSIWYSIACHHTLELCLNLQVCTVSPGNVCWNSLTSSSFLSPLASIVLLVHNKNYGLYGGHSRKSHEW